MTAWVHEQYYYWLWITCYDVGCHAIDRLNHDLNEYWDGL